MTTSAAKNTNIQPTPRLRLRYHATSSSPTSTATLRKSNTRSDWAESPAARRRVASRYPDANVAAAASAAST